MSKYFGRFSGVKNTIRHLLISWVTANVFKRHGYLVLPVIPFAALGGDSAAHIVSPNKINDRALIASHQQTAAKAPREETTQAGESLPRRVDQETAVSPVYRINSRYCRNKDAEDGSEGEDFVRECKGYGGYVLRASGFDYRINYGIKSADPQKTFDVMLFPLEAGAAAEYVRADLYDQKLADTIEWRLDSHGKPFAVLVRAAFYKNTGSARTFLNPKNKVAEFIFVRGLAGYEDLKEDVPTAGTAYNPEEQARLIAQKYLEKRVAFAEPILKASTEIVSAGEKTPPPSLIDALLASVDEDDSASFSECLKGPKLKRSQRHLLFRAVQLPTSKNSEVLYFVRPSLEPYCGTFYGAHLFRYWLVLETAPSIYRILYAGAGDSFEVMSSRHGGYFDIQQTNCWAGGCRSAKLQYNGKEYIASSCTEVTFNEDGSESTRDVPCSATDVQSPTKIAKKVKLYTSYDDSTGYKTVQRDIEVENGALAKAIINELLKEGIGFPEGTKILSINLEGDTLYIDSSKEFEKIDIGSAGTPLMVGSIVNSLTEIPTIKKVQFLVEGKRITLNHADFSEPISRNLKPW